MSIEKNLDKQLQQYAVEANKDKYLMIRLQGQLFGIKVDHVEDVLSPQAISPVPLSPPEVMGLLNLRGRVVTAIDIGVKLGMAATEKKAEYRSVVVEYKDNLYSFVVDEVSEVIAISQEKIAHVPDNLSEAWKDVSSGVYSLEKDLMVILEVDHILYMPDDKEGESDE